jgi:hypothetical protein
MSLRYGVPGLLAGEPASGYDLARRCEEALGSTWPAKPPYRGHVAAKDRGGFGDSPQAMSSRVGTEAGLRPYEALADRAEWARKVPPAGPRP